eukprot:Pompholyxophrys_punicea_v1_NODE_541_length_1718_cov_135.763680.p2 type:complete len:145 gc:universal NODE_541_length_1718_cov_135.763680:641-207(-)
MCRSQVEQASVFFFFFFNIKYCTGTTSDGNTARRFFANSDVVASITGLDVEILKKFETLARTLACGYPVHCEKMRIFAWNLADLCPEVWLVFYAPFSSQSFDSWPLGCPTSPILFCARWNAVRRGTRNQQQKNQSGQTSPCKDL